VINNKVNNNNNDGYCVELGVYRSPFVSDIVLKPLLDVYLSPYGFKRLWAQDFDYVDNSYVLSDYNVHLIDYFSTYSTENVVHSVASLAESNQLELFNSIKSKITDRPCIHFIYVM
jgi:hypothetical protein